MDLQVEIPIWYDGKMKWISNLTRRSTCSDVITAILFADGVECPSASERPVLYESWCGVERPLKARCRLLKLWHSWADEANNVTLTVRHQRSQTNATHVRLAQQEKKLKKFRRQLKRADRPTDDTGEQMIAVYVNLYRSIVDLQRQVESHKRLVTRLKKDIDGENRSANAPLQCTGILSDVNRTLIVSRQLTEQSEQLDHEIQRINEEIDRKHSLLDELELDDALEQNIDIDSLDSSDEDDDDGPSTATLRSDRTSQADVSSGSLSFVNTAGRRTSLVTNDRDCSTLV
jgi:hypothetical protein